MFCYLVSTKSIYKEQKLKHSFEKKIHQILMTVTLESETVIIWNESQSTLNVIKHIK